MNAEALLPHRRQIRAGIALALLGALALLAFSGASLHPSALPCGVHLLTGLPCPFCGGTRAARAILVGNWHRAFYLNPLAFPALLLIGATGIVLLVEASTGRAVLPWGTMSRQVSRWGAVLMALTMLWWIPHLVLALRTPKPELVDLRNPIAAGLRRAIAPEARK